MFDKISPLLDFAKSEGADYADIRYEVRQDTNIVFNSKELDEIGSNSGDGYVVRVLAGGGMSQVTFTRFDNARAAIKSAVENAKLLGERRDKPVKFADVAPAKETVKASIEIDPRDIDIKDKLEMTRKYNDIALKYEQIVNTNLAYREVIRDKFFLSTDGAEINEELVTVAVSGLLTAKEDSLLQNIRVASGGSTGFGTVQNIEDLFEKRSKTVIDLLKAEPVKGGQYNMILNPSLAGVFAHEAFGHFSEADIIESLPAMRERMQIGSKLGSDVISIVDDATMPFQLGKYKYDDEGVPVRRVQLLKNGVLTGRLHSRKTAAEFNEPISGHTVAEDYRYAPIVRMGTIFIEPGMDTFDNLLEKLGDGLYICDAKGGQTAGENFTFGAQYGYKVENGKIAGMIRDINISGNLYKTLMDIEAVGNDLTLGKTGGCGKGQTNIRSTHGGPHVLINNLVLGGV